MSRTKRKPEIEATILIVDDNADNRLLLASQLGMHGYTILEAPDGPTGLQIVREQMPDLILLDVMMPKMNGFEVCEVLKTDPVTSPIPVIIITALRDIEYRIQGIKVGADEFLSRPHHREELLVRVRSLVRLKHARDQLAQEHDQLQLLYDVARATNTQLDLNQVMFEIITHTRAAVGATKGSIMLLNEEQQITHKILIREGLTPRMTENVTQAVLHEGLAGWVLRERRTLIIDDAMADARWITLPDDVEQIGSAIGVPLTKEPEAQVRGVLVLVHPTQNYFREKHARLLETIAAQVSVAVHNAYLFNEVNEQRRKLSAVLAQSTDAIFTTDEEQRLSLFNHAAEGMFGLQTAQIAGQLLHDIKALSPAIPLFDRAVLHGPVTGEIHLAHGRVLFGSVTPIPDVGFMAVMQDVTEMKRMEQMRLEQERQEKERVKGMFARYMSPRLVEQVLSNEPGLLGQRQRRRAVVMFADLRGFTSMIVGLEPRVSITILNEFFSQMTEVVYEYDGTIFDLAGDELMVGFNVPIDQSDAAYRAVLTAVSMQNRFDELRLDWFNRTGVHLGLGIGIDEGDVIMGNVGAETRMNFAMVGEAVNTAHRLVDLAQDGQVVISQSIYDELLIRETQEFPAEFSSMGEVSLKGKPLPQTLYRFHFDRTPLELSRPLADNHSGLRDLKKDELQGTNYDVA